jgi:3-oxoacyl-[acyl-carrier-protein] synthase-3
MALFSTSNVSIRGVAASVPLQREYNEEVNWLSPHEKELLIKQVGIRERRVAPAGMHASDLCYEAAKRLLRELGWEPSDVQFLIFVTQTPDFVIPGTSMTLQDRLSLPKSCMALDINQGCAGYVYGLAIMASLLAASNGRRGLLLVGDTITHLIDKADKTLRPIFSDAGSCTALEFNKKADDLHFNLMTDGSRYDAIIVKNRESTPKLEAGGKLEMKGHEIFKFGLEDIAPNVRALIAYAQRSIDEFDYLIMHQANRLLNEAIRKKIGIESSKVPYSLADYGNTSCATIPLTMVTQLRKEVRNRKLNHLLCGFGVGLSWGTASLTSENIVCPDLIEL